MLIHEFHSKLDLRSDPSTLFHALRRLRSLSGAKVLAAAGGGWVVWTDAQDPDDDGSSFRVAATA
jgi:hypothetical protein